MMMFKTDPGGLQVNPMSIYVCVRNDSTETRWKRDEEDLFLKVFQYILWKYGETFSSIIQRNIIYFDSRNLEKWQ